MLTLLAKGNTHFISSNYYFWYTDTISGLTYKILFLSSRILYLVKVY